MRLATNFTYPPDDRGRHRIVPPQSSHSTLVADRMAGLRGTPVFIVPPPSINCGEYRSWPLPALRRYVRNLSAPGFTFLEQDEMQIVLESDRTENDESADHLQHGRNFTEHDRRDESDGGDGARQQQGGRRRPSDPAEPNPIESSSTSTLVPRCLKRTSKSSSSRQSDHRPSFRG